MNQIVYQETLDKFINSCLITKTIADEVKQGMFNAGYTHVMHNWETS